MNPFSVDDKVQAKASGKRNGTVVYIMCGTCDSCKSKNYSACVAEVKNRVMASFREGEGYKRFKYDYAELDLEPPLPTKPTPKTYDHSPKDVRHLGDVLLDVPLIVSEEDEPEDNSVDVVFEEEQQEEVKPASKLATKPTTKIFSPMTGMFFDKFLEVEVMGRPI